MGQAASTEVRGERLSRERILEMAIALVRRDGHGALSMRRLAQELDVWPMSLYRYFHDKDELIAALADAAADSITLPEASRPWRDQMHELLTEARAAIERYPSSLSPQANGPASVRVQAAGLTILEGAGVAEGEAASAWWALLAFTAGAAALGLGSEDFEFGLRCLLDGCHSQVGI